jgi:uncharacterized protein with GYD domain
MSTYILMTKLAPDAMNLKNREKIGQKWMKEVSKKCPEVKWVSHFVLLGPYDFMDIFEAPNEEVAAKVSMISLASGALKAESWTAIPYNRFLELVDDI